jgi:hypothetical protein
MAVELVMFGATSKYDGLSRLFSCIPHHTTQRYGIDTNFDAAASAKINASRKQQVLDGTRNPPDSCRYSLARVQATEALSQGFDIFRIYNLIFGRAFLYGENRCLDFKRR